MLFTQVARIRFLPRTNLNTGYHHSVAISVLRGLAALQVAAAHVRAQFYPGLSTMADPGLGYQVLAFFTGFAHQSVVIFFVLSGWLVGGSLMNRVGQPGAIASYAVDRITRLWIVLVPAFAASLLIGAMIGEVSPVLPDIASTGEYSLLVFVGNMFGLQDLAVPRYGGNFALWSLTYESWYYVLFPCTVLMFAGATHGQKAGAAAALAFVAWQLNTAILLYFLLWLMGAGFSRIHIRIGGATKWLFVAGFGLVAVWFRIKGSNNILLEDSFVQDLLYSLLFLTLLCSLQTPVSRDSKMILAVDRVGRFFAEFSFSLYVIHVPLIFLLRHIHARLLGTDELDPDKLSDFWSYLSMVVLIVIVAWLFHLPFEAQTFRVRKRLKELLPTRPVPQNLA
ncbi:MAG: acyltransferase family protein [Telluria sp.]